ncbi:SDR family NAD(P)-dependent oxidoreductase [Aliiglaciecola sp. LCG003]|uniref:SDR family NAD(P)-dependent oxidoreductase n=1 Tax=Aliiglaciecola sp. LCG003 TaxID=3053655 RepID=UPI00257230EF|nr:SDR family NAD(P)-dependent oxidoreductase [Aliiglaciecola sp. LCG003]WJG09959.1 SDR family NAD(P)-dependent oxidoreductase [Aliiglaciecola sp. LCG003]
MKTILITGATSGIGESLAKTAAENGYQVIACGRNQQKLAQLSSHSNVQSLAFDVSDAQQTKQALASVQADIYVFNAGVCEYVDVNQFEAAMFERVFSANFFGIVNCVESVLPTLKAGNQVVMVDSLARLLPFTRSQAYGASKAALHYFCKSLEVDLADKQILLQSVSPGFIETPLTDKNDFEMPMKISSKQAARAFLKGIEKRRSNIYFPWGFSLILRTLNLLPTSWQVAICKKMRQS